MLRLSEDLWSTHDFKVKMLDWSAARGSRLAHTCRRCSRGFCRFVLLIHGVWAIDTDGRVLEDAVTQQWLSEACPRVSNEGDNGSRARLRDSAVQ